MAEECWFQDRKERTIFDEFHQKKFYNYFEKVNQKEKDDSDNDNFLEKIYFHNYLCYACYNFAELVPYVLHMI